MHLAADAKLEDVLSGIKAASRRCAEQVRRHHELPRLGGEELATGQERVQNKKFTEEELRRMFHPDSVAEIPARKAKKGSGVYDDAKVIDSIRKSTEAAKRTGPGLCQRADLRGAVQ